jgi:ATP-dependent DNA helicase RecQ
MILFTAGHSTATVGEFIELLRAHDVELLVDVRSKPRSRLSHFDQVPLQEAVESAGMRYRFMGDLVGGMPRDPRVAERWRQGKLDPIIIDHLRHTDEWQEGVAEIARLVRRGTVVCLMCSEADASECHRKAVALDVTAVLPGVALHHVAVRTAGAPQEVGVQAILL